VIRPIQIVFHQMETVPQVEGWIRSEAEKLDRYYARITGCRVGVEFVHRRYRSENPYQVKIELSVPGEEIVATQQPAIHGAMKHFSEPKRVKRLEGPEFRYKDLHAALADAFKAAKRRLEDYACRQRQQVKTRIASPRARLARIFTQQGYGFLAAPDGRQIYFHKGSVLNGQFHRLHVGDEVIFSEEMGEKGPQASTVRLTRRTEVARPADRPRKIA
jgi:cold shock CspA family protein